TSDLDKLTGDPAFVNNLKNLVNGLSKLVSSTQDLQQQVQVAQTLAPIDNKINQQKPPNPQVTANLTNSNQKLNLALEEAHKMIVLHNQELNQANRDHPHQ
ncbi:MAG TPA: hypothetical protein V6C58_23780, partial [Allocoleopsis sp.]